MPNRLIRDGLLDSEAVLSLPVEARWLYVSILLSADDVGLFEATPFRLARRADVQRNHADKLLAMLADVDLVRLYEVDGKRFGFIPRYGQRLQIKRCRHPHPELALLHGDEDAISKIKHLASIPTVESGCSPCGTVAQPPEPEPEPELKTKRATETLLAQDAPQPVAKAPATPRAKRLAADWVLPKAWGDWAVQEMRWAPEQIRLEADKFADFWHSKAGAGATKLDWLKTWRNWCRNAKGPYAGHGQAQHETQYEAAARRRAEQFAPHSAVKAPGARQQQEFIDVDAKRLD